MDHSSHVLGCSRVDEVGNGVLGDHDGELGAGERTHRSSRSAEGARGRVGEVLSIDGHGAT